MVEITTTTTTDTTTPGSITLNLATFQSVLRLLSPLYEVSGVYVIQKNRRLFVIASDNRRITEVEFDLTTSENFSVYLSASLTKMIALIPCHSLSQITLEQDKSVSIKTDTFNITQTNSIPLIPFKDFFRSDAPDTTIHYIKNLKTAHRLRTRPFLPDDNKTITTMRIRQEEDKHYLQTKYVKYALALFTDLLTISVNFRNNSVLFHGDGPSIQEGRHFYKTTIRHAISKIDPPTP